MLRNPCIELGEDRCKFYTDTLGTEKYGHCLILGRGAQPLDKVKDDKNKTITKEQIVWFNNNCPDYPTLEDQAKDHTLLPSCSFDFKVQVVTP